MAILYVNNPGLIYYLPLLMISGLVSGTLIGILGAVTINRLQKFLKHHIK